MKNLLNVILIFLFVGMYSCNGQKPTNKEVTKMLESTNLEIEKGNLKAATELLDKIEKWDSTNGNVYALRAKIAYFESDYTKALQLADNAIYLMPKNASLLCLKGEIFLETGDADSALLYCFQCVENDKSDNSYYSLALAYKANKDFTKSLKYLDSALLLNKDYITYSQKGEVYFILKEYKQAIEECNKALALNSKDGLSYFRRGVCYLKLKDISKCCEDYRNALPLLKDESTIQDIRVFLEKYCK